MKKNIHPKYEVIAVTCSCGEKFETRSTLGKKDLHIEVCSKCHPFYTGKQKVMDTAGRIDRFTKKFGNRFARADQKDAEDAADKKDIEGA